MAFFHANVTQMQRQADSLREEAQRLRNISYELQSCMQRLRPIDFLSQQKAALQKAYQRANEEYASMLLLVRGLESVIRLYQTNERRCETPTNVAGRGGNRFLPVYGSTVSIQAVTHTGWSTSVGLAAGATGATGAVTSGATASGSAVSGAPPTGATEAGSIVSGTAGSHASPATVPRMLADWQPTRFWRNPYPWRQGARPFTIDMNKLSIRRCAMWANSTILGLIQIEGRR